MVPRLPFRQPETRCREDETEVWDGLQDAVTCGVTFWTAPERVARP